jgi:hypothetical protein
MVIARASLIEPWGSRRLKLTQHVDIRQIREDHIHRLHGNGRNLLPHSGNYFLGIGMGMSLNRT